MKVRQPLSCALLGLAFSLAGCSGGGTTWDGAPFATNGGPNGGTNGGGINGGGTNGGGTNGGGGGVSLNAIAPQGGRFLDVNQNGLVDAGDQLIMSFARSVTVNAAGADAIHLPVQGDTLGTGSTVAQGPTANDVTVTLGNGAKLTPRGGYSGTTQGSPSIVQISSAMSPSNAIVGTDGSSVASVTSVDLMPGLVTGSQVAAAAKVLGSGDMDGDGDTDLVVADNGARVLLNNGSGAFTDSGQVLGNGDVSTIAIGDLDGDQDLDLILGHPNGQDEVIKNTTTGGTLSFAAATLLADVTTTKALALIDVDRDGDLDLFVGNGNSEPDRVYRNAAGTLTDSGLRIGTLSTSGASVGDFDGDGDDDLALSASPAGTTLRNDTPQGGAPVFNAAQSLTGASTGVATIDVERDGDVDLLVGTGTALTLYVNTGGVLAVSSQTVAVAANKILASDIDGDGFKDVITDADVIANDRGKLVRSQESGFGGVVAIATLDADRDGDTDVALGKGADGVQIKRGSGTRKSPLAFDSEGAWSGRAQTVAKGDVDGDGDVDLVTGAFAASGSLAQVLKNNGSGGFTQASLVPGPGRTSTSLALGDLDGDGDLDLIEGTSGLLIGTRIYANDGAGNFTYSGNLINLLSTGALALGDLDGDGDLDVVAANLLAGDHVYLNDGAGNLTFTKHGLTIGLAVNTTSAGLGDMDGDGDLDLFLSQATGGRVLRNDGSANFTDTGQNLGPAGASGIALTDVDRDGDLDLIQGQVLLGHANRVFLNNGAGTYTSGAALGMWKTTCVAARDLDLDGDTDLIFGNAFGQADAIYLNDGAGGFTLQMLTEDSDTRALIVDDLDNDGDLDVATASGTDGTLLGRLLRNR